MCLRQSTRVEGPLDPSSNPYDAESTLCVRRDATPAYDLIAPKLALATVSPANCEREKLLCMLPPSITPPKRKVIAPPANGRVAAENCAERLPRRNSAGLAGSTRLK